MTQDELRDALSDSYPGIREFLRQIDALDVLDGLPALRYS